MISKKIMNVETKKAFKVQLIYQDPSKIHLYPKKFKALNQLPFLSLEFPQKMNLTRNIWK